MLLPSKKDNLMISIIVNRAATINEHFLLRPVWTRSFSNIDKSPFERHRNNQTRSPECRSPDSTRAFTAHLFSCVVVDRSAIPGLKLDKNAFNPRAKNTAEMPRHYYYSRPWNNKHRRSAGSQICPLMSLFVRGWTLRIGKKDIHSIACNASKSGVEVTKRKYICYSK